MSNSMIKDILLGSPLSVSAPLFLLFLVLIYRVALKYTQRRRDVEFGRKHGCQPAKSFLHYKWPFALDLIKDGFAARREKKLIYFITKCIGNLDSTAELSLFGGQGFITIEPKNIEALLSTQFEDFHFGARSLGMHAMIGDGIFTQDGKEWRHSRDILQRRFRDMRYQNLKGFHKHVEDLIDRLHAVSSEQVDLQHYFYWLTINTTISMILGQPVKSFKGETELSFSTAFDEASRVTGTRLRLGDVYYLYHPRGFSEACKTIKQYTYDFVTEILSKNSKGHTEIEEGSFIQDLYNDKPDLESVRDQVLNVLIAGRDTTAAAMSYAFLLLLRHPDIFETLRREINQVVGARSAITRTDIYNMPYLHNVFKETLRLYPSAPVNTRFCRKTTTLPLGGGSDGLSPLLIPKDTPVAYSVYHMQRRKDIYGPDALSFRPERWDEERLADIGWAYLPFNGGPRVCLGKDFARMLASYGIIRVIQEFPTMRLVSRENTAEAATERHNLNVTMSSADGCKVILT